MPRLIVIKSNLAVKEVELDGVLTIGRHESNLLQLNEDRASRTHCRIRTERDRTVVEDLDSANGTYVNGLKVTSHVLSNNDRITIGGSTLVFEDTPPPSRGGDTVVLKASEEEPVKEKTPQKAPATQANGADAGPRKAPAAAPAARPRAREKRSSKNSMTTLVLSAFLLLASLWFLFEALKKKPEAQESRVVRREKKAVVPVAPVQQTPIEAPVERPAEVIQPAPTAARVPLDTRLNSALALRDRALASGNFLGAKAALRSFLSALNNDETGNEIAARARRELDETERLSRSAFELSLTQAREALNARRFQAAIQRATGLLSNDPNGDFGNKARALLEGIDEHTAPVAESARAKAADAIKAGRLDLARAALEAVMGDLAGTRWAEDISAQHLQIIMTAGLLDEIEAARAKAVAAGKVVRVSLGNKKLDGTLAGIKGFSAQIASGAATLTVSLNSFETADLNRLLDELDFEERHAELGCLWMVLGRKDAALAESEAALKNPGRAPLAVCLAGMLSQSRNLHLYDFSSWRQQADWEALSGSWMTLNGKYVLESSDGGETVLKSERIGGAFPLENARVNFEFTVSSTTQNWAFVCEFGSGARGVSVEFSNGEAVLANLSDAKSNTKFKWPGNAARVELAVIGDAVAVQIDGKPAATLTVGSLKGATGSLGFQARQCACSLDNVVLRSVTK